MMDSLSLFDAIANNPYIRKVSLIIFLNKSDLFKKMLPIHPIKKAFPSYTGEDDNLEKSTDFIKKQFEKMAMNDESKRTVCVHVTHVTDSTAFRTLIESVMLSIINDNLVHNGLL